METEELKTNEELRNEILETALHYVDKGFSIVPARKDKVPHVRWQDFQVRKPTREEVISWWKTWPDANVAIVTGKISGITIVDVEAGGDISKFPETMTIKTGGGGWHFYYQYYETKTTSRVLELTDIRSDGGIVIAAPSVHSSGNKYEVINRREFAPFPFELFGEKDKPIETVMSRMFGEVIPVGSRNDTAASYLGTLLIYIPENKWDSFVLPQFELYNDTMLDPPLPERELFNIYQSITQTERRRVETGEHVGDAVLLNKDDEKFIISIPIGDGFAFFEFNDVEYSSKSISVIIQCSVEMRGVKTQKFEERINILSNSSKESFTRMLKESFPRDKKKTGWPLIFSQACQLLIKTIKVQSQEEEYVHTPDVYTKYILKPFIEDDVSNIIFGMGGSGKTYLTLKMALCIALNKPFMGVLPDRQVNTLFIDYENTNSIFHMRITHMSKSMNMENDPEIFRRLFYYNPKGAPIHEQKQQILEIIKKRNIELIIVDSAAMACGGEPESAEVANRLFNALGRFKVSVMLIAHETKNTKSKSETPFGSVFFYNCARNIWNIRRAQRPDDNAIHVTLAHKKSNNDRISSDKTVKIVFGDGTVQVTEGDFNQVEKVLVDKKETAKTRILEELEDGEYDYKELVDLTGLDYHQVRSRMSELLKAKKVEQNALGKWNLKLDEDSDEINNFS